MVMKKEILVAVAGLTPQVITETLYYLTQVKKPRSKISEIYILTTLPGKEIISKTLLGSKKGRFFEFCREYGIKPSSIKFDKDSIIVLNDTEGKPLTDVRTAHENEVLANQIVNFIREKTSDENTVLHCSVAGGRKTMSVYLAYALMLFGRPNDTLSHVLVDEKLEKNRGFFYPKKPSRGKASVDLAEIPYVRLRDKIRNLFGSEKLTFSRMVKIAQREIDTMPLLENLEINLKKRYVRIGEKEITLKPKLIALYAHFAERRRTLSDETSFQLLKGANSISSNPDDIKAYIRKMLPEANLERYRFSRENILQDISKINKQIEDALDDSTIAFYYKITSSEPGKRTYGATKYGIRLSKSKIKPLVLP
jgi:CRISPR-associated protein (TIGR02584 family)